MYKYCQNFASNESFIKNYWRSGKTKKFENNELTNINISWLCMVFMDSFLVFHRRTTLENSPKCFLFPLVHLAQVIWTFILMPPRFIARIRKCNWWQWLCRGWKNFSCRKLFFTPQGDNTVPDYHFYDHEKRSLSTGPYRRHCTGCMGGMGLASRRARTGKQPLMNSRATGRKSAHGDGPGILKSTCSFAATPDRKSVV